MGLHFYLRNIEYVSQSAIQRTSLIRTYRGAVIEMIARDCTLVGVAHSSGWYDGSG
jgi:hypothetical protein